MSDVDISRDRIERLKIMGVADYIHIAMLDRIEELEAKLSESEALLAKAVEALEFYATQDVTYPNVGTVTFHGHDDNGCKARATLAELTGGKDE